MSLRELDPRAALLCLLAATACVLFIGDAGVLASTTLALLVLSRCGAVWAWLRLLRALLPLAVCVMVFDMSAGGAGTGSSTPGRLVALATLGLAFARAGDGERLLAALAALRVPYGLSFVLVNGLRLVPSVWEDVAALRDSARLRGVRLDGPPWRQLGGWRRLLVPLLVTTVRRGLQLGEAMEARAFGVLPARTRRHTLRWRPTDTLMTAGAALYLTVTAAAGTAIFRLAGWALHAA